MNPQVLLQAEPGWFQKPQSLSRLKMAAVSRLPALSCRYRRVDSKKIRKSGRGPEIPSPNGSAQTLGKGIRLEPEGLQFLKPAEVEICYASSDLTGLNEKSTMIYYKNDSGELIAIAGTVDQSRHCVRGTIEHFSSYVAAAFAFVPGNTAPNIGGANFLPSTPFAGIPLRVRTAINDVNGGATPGTVVSAFLYYRTIGAPSYTKVALLPDTTDNTVTNRYYHLIPASQGIKFGWNPILL